MICRARSISLRPRFRFVATWRSPFTSRTNAGRIPTARSEVSLASAETESSEPRMASLSSTSPLMKSLNSMISSLSCLSRLESVSSTMFRLSIRSPITWSRSARVLVSDAVLCSSPLKLSPSPWKTEITSAESLLMSVGDSAWNNGLNPLNSTVRSSAGSVRSIGIVPSAGSRLRSPTPWVSWM